jgi:hypothetical protein
VCVIHFCATRILDRNNTSALSLQDPAGIFELIEVVGNGTYGQVYKVGILATRCVIRLPMQKQ